MISSTDEAQSLVNLLFDISGSNDSSFFMDIGDEFSSEGLFLIDIFEHGDRTVQNSQSTDGYNGIKI